MNVIRTKKGKYQGFQTVLLATTNAVEKANKIADIIPAVLLLVIMLVR